MQPISYARHQFPAEIIRHAVWLYLRFTLSYRDVEELLAERGIETSYESIRRWVLKGPCSLATCVGFGPDRRAGGTWTKWWSRSRASACICGEPSTAKVRCWTCWSRPSATPRLPFGSCRDPRPAIRLRATVPRYQVRRMKPHALRPPQHARNDRP